MRLSGRIAAAIEILDDLAVRKRPVSVALRDWAASHRFAGSKDRAAIGNLVYDVERKRLSLAHQMQGDSARLLVIGTLLNEWAISPEQLNEGFEQDKFAPDLLSAVEIANGQNAEALSNAPDHVIANIPAWLEKDFSQVFAENWVAEGQKLASRPPLDLRVNALNSTPDRVLKSLKRFSPERSDFSQTALRVNSAAGDVRTPNVKSDESYQKGWVEVQDLGSQLVSILSGISSGDQVLDYCAGAGGKTLALAAQMANKGQIFAHDADYHRLAPIYERLKRSDAHNVQVRKPEAGNLDDLVGQMSHVFVDAPCSGTGTWRRHPDTKWRLTQEQLQKRVAEQQTVLHQASAYVRPQGRIVYVTCSVLPTENDQQIERFISDSGLYVTIDPAQLWAESFGDGAIAAQVSDRGLTLTPRRTGTDGFYISVLQRKN